MSVHLITVRFDKNMINEKSLYPIFESDMDFTENQEFFRKNTLKLGYVNEAQRLSKEIYDRRKKLLEVQEDEYAGVYLMIQDVFKVKGFVARSSYYKEYTFEIVDTEFEYVVIIAYTTED